MGLLEHPTGADEGRTFEDALVKVRAVLEVLQVWEEPANSPHEEVPPGLLMALTEARDALNSAGDRLVEATPNAIARGAAAELDVYAWGQA